MCVCVSRVLEESIGINGCNKCERKKPGKRKKERMWKTSIQAKVSFKSLKKREREKDVKKSKETTLSV